MTLPAILATDWAPPTVQGMFIVALCALCALCTWLLIHFRIIP